MRGMPDGAASMNAVIPLESLIIVFPVETMACSAALVFAVPSAVVETPLVIRMAFLAVATIPISLGFSFEFFLLHGLMSILCHGTGISN